MRNFRAEARALVAQMTLEEKVSQMLYNAPAIERLNIPSYNWWNEALHGVARSGVATVFPQAIALAATFDAALLSQVAEAISDEARAKYHAYQEEGDHGIYKGLTFWSPNINIFRDPRWGRGHETYGEDPYLTARLGVAFIKALQGEDPNIMKAAACAKHFAVHSGPESERHAFDAVTDDYDLWNTYLPAFEAAVKEARVEAVMGAYNRTNGEPCCGHRKLLTEILREKWGFDGHVTSDCWAIADFHQTHHVTDTAVESVALAIRNGCDLNCGNLFGYALAAVQEGKLTEDEIDRAVTNLMATRLKLGIAGEAATGRRYISIPYEAVDGAKHQMLNMRAAMAAPVLLKNNGVLPLDTRAYRTVGVIGPNADSREALQGNYFGTASQYKTVLSGIQESAERYQIRVLYAQGSPLTDSHDPERTGNTLRPNGLLAEALTVAKHSDAIVLCVGLDGTVEGEQGDAGDGDRPSLQLPECQRLLCERVRAAAPGKPIVLVNITGSATDLRWADGHADAVLQVFYPGALGGLAVAGILFGLASPEGRLPVTFYRSDEDLPDFRDYSMKERTYRYFTGEPLYPFGFGLGYDRFEVLGAEYKDGCVVTQVVNMGALTPNPNARPGDADFPTAETVQVYAETAGTRERWVLCGIAKVTLSQGQGLELEISIDGRAFARYDANGDLRPVDGAKKLYVGFCQPDARSMALKGHRPLEVTL